MIQILRTFALVLIVAFAVGQDTSAASVPAGMCISIDDAEDVTDDVGDLFCGGDDVECTFQCGDDGKLDSVTCECL